MTNSQINTPLFSGGASGDYLRVECNKCKDRCSLAFLGFDPVIPLIRVSCPTHGVLWEGKVDGYDIVNSVDSRESSM